jgi:Uma2 family endonuclease
MEYDKKTPSPKQIKESGWTVEDYYQLPEDGNQYEIISGKLELKPSPTTTHQRISQQLLRTMLDSCELDYIIMHAPIDVILSENDTRQPDLLMVHRSREEIIEERGVVGPPDLVVEIISPSSAKRDRTMKRETYARHGVPEYWIVDPSNLTIEQYVLIHPGQPYELIDVYDSEDTIKSERVPCLSFVVKEGLKIK